MTTVSLDKRFHLTWGTLLFVAVHVGALSAFVVYPSWPGIVLMAALFFIRMFAITGGYHRYFAHHSFKTNRIFQFCLAFIGGTAAQKGVLWWVAHHRHHHLYSDTDKDIHSAQREGFYWSHLGWLLSREYHDEYDPKMVKDLSKFPELVWLDKNHLFPPIFLAITCFLTLGLVGLVWGFFVGTVLLYHFTFSINSVCHMFGTRRYATSESSRNTWWLSFFTLGENWHNNHHQFPRSARHGLYWYEIDVTYYAIRILSFLGMASDIKLIDAAKIKAAITVPAASGSLDDASIESSKGL